MGMHFRFNKGDDVPQWLIKTEPIIGGVVTFGCDVDVAINSIRDRAIIRPTLWTAFKERLKACITWSPAEVVLVRIKNSTDAAMKISGRANVLDARRFGKFRIKSVGMSFEGA